MPWVLVTASLGVDEVCHAVTCERPDSGQLMEMVYRVGQGRGWMEYELWGPVTS